MAGPFTTLRGSYWPLREQSNGKTELAGPLTTLRGRVAPLWEQFQRHYLDGGASEYLKKVVLPPCGSLRNVTIYMAELSRVFSSATEPGDP